MDDKLITLTLSADDARAVLRAVKARATHWGNPGVISRHSCAANIRKTYHGVAEDIAQQMTDQGVTF